MKKLIAVSALALALTACTTTPPRTYAQVQQAQATAKTVDALPPGTFGDGTYLVGTDIAPGVYVTAGPDPTSVWPMCYYARLRGLDGSVSSIIANENFKGREVLEIKATDRAVKFNNGCYWTRKGA